MKNLNYKFEYMPAKEYPFGYLVSFGVNSTTNSTLAERIKSKLLHDFCNEKDCKYMIDLRFERQKKITKKDK